jgi:hypothetical protein
VTKVSEVYDSKLRELRTTIHDIFRSLRKFCHQAVAAPHPEANHDSPRHPEFVMEFYFASFAFFAAMLLFFGYGCAALGPSW